MLRVVRWRMRTTQEGAFRAPNSVIYIVIGLHLKKIEIFVSASLAMKLREYTRNTPIKRNPVLYKILKKNFLTVIF